MAFSDDILGNVVASVIAGVLIKWGPWVTWLLFWFVVWLLWLVWLRLRQFDCVRWLLWECVGWAEGEEVTPVVERPEVHRVWRVAASFFDFAKNCSAAFYRTMRDAKNRCLGRSDRE
ncbi:hypothetical protein QBC34DRAFT_383713 [Podospora aff. communis PSN243]|uniref:Uncharacterized protein n=1 Tax=Podospora aff. communis PSN243 TaxID=3040156 RepID=A0AAV9GFB5_9PEZI|nr:hypothetical protein QBC34DRAFT_383713 [Podospora aff. communis PSN243]